MLPRLDATQMRERDDKADGSVTAHAEVADVCLKKITPAAQARSVGSVSSAPTRTSEPRGSFTTAERKSSKWVRKTRSLSATLPPKSGPPLTTTRVGFAARMRIDHLYLLKRGTDVAILVERVFQGIRKFAFRRYSRHNQFYGSHERDRKVA